MDPVSSLSSKPPPRVTPTTPKKKALPEGETPVWKVGARRGGPWKGARVGPTAPVEQWPSEAARSGSTGPTRAPFQLFTFCRLTKPPLSCFLQRRQQLPQLGLTRGIFLLHYRLPYETDQSFLPDVRGQDRLHNAPAPHHPFHPEPDLFHLCPRQEPRGLPIHRAQHPELDRNHHLQHVDDLPLRDVIQDLEVRDHHHVPPGRFFLPVNVGLEHLHGHGLKARAMPIQGQ